MLDQVKRWFVGDDADVDINRLAAWSRESGWEFKRVREGDGFAIEGLWMEHSWRMEWGPSQRSYIRERELRLRMELGLHPELQMLLLNRTLTELLEGRAFEQFTQTTQTIIDDSTPEEMRWLSIHPKVRIGPSKVVRARFGAWSNAPSLVSWWFDGPLSLALEELANEWLPENIPFLVMALRGRLYLRVQVPVPSKELLSLLHGVFLVAAEQALRVAKVGPGESLPFDFDHQKAACSTWGTSRPVDIDTA